MADDIDAGQSNTTIDQALAPAETDSNPGAATVADTTASPEGDMTFFDPENVPEPLQGAYKSMQGEFTRKMQDIASSKRSDEDVAKIQAFDRFAANPQSSIRALAQQHNVSLDSGTQSTQDLSNWQPQTWQEVVDTTATRAQTELMNKLEPMITPVINELQSLKSKDIRRQLDESYPEWKRHEPEMKALLEKHSSLHDDPVTLAKLAIPEAEHEAKAFKKAMKELEKNAKSSKVSSGSIGVQSSTSSNEKLSFQESVLKAKRSMGR